MFKKKYLLFVLALAPLLFLVSPETASAQAVPQNHESCTQGIRFHYSMSRDVLDWGTQVNCGSPLVYRIDMDAYLAYEQPDRTWLQVSSVHGRCILTTQCTRTETLRVMPWGDYKITYCFGAESLGSDWPYICNATFKTIP